MKILFSITILFFTAWSCGAMSVERKDSVVLPHDQVMPNAIYITPNNRSLCPETSDTRPPNRVNTTEVLRDLRTAMNSAGNLPGTHTLLHAYLVPYEDEHGSGGADYDKRLEHVSGFSGSNGFAWVTNDQGGSPQTDRAALWADGRYWEQADQQMDCNWILMQDGDVNYPDAVTWLNEIFNGRNAIKIGIDPKLVSIDTWQWYESGLASNIELVDMLNHELVDVIWTTDRPARPNNNIYEHTVEFAGEAWGDKILRVETEIKERGADVLVMHALDETAWVFNTRGSDRDTSPYFYSYGIILNDTGVDRRRLYLVNHLELIKNETIRNHLNTDTNGNCPGPVSSSPCVNVRNYDNVMADIATLAGQSKKIWLDPGASYAVYNQAWHSTDNRIVEASPVQLIKSVKNSVERSKYRECQIRDSAAVAEFLAELEKDIKDGKTWTELEASHRVTEIRSQYPHYDRDSFHPISAVGPNAAVTHYRPTEETDTRITTSDVYLLDSGGQYLDGTTDVTRTVHFGTPTDVEKEAYTRVLMGAIDLEDTVWPEGLRGTDLDVRSRAYLYEHGWDFNHNTGHGIGYFLGVHEGPPSIGVNYNPDHSPLYEGMFLSDEPGYYEEGKFGIRLETIVAVEEAETENHYNNKRYLTFNAVTLVPFEPNMIDYDMLTFRHRMWLNAYHARCEKDVGDYLKDVRNNDLAYDWLLERTKKIPDEPNYEPITGAAGRSEGHLAAVVMATLIALGMALRKC